LPYDPFPLQIEKGSQNFTGVQAGSFHDVINMHWLVDGEHFHRVSFPMNLAKRQPAEFAARPLGPRLVPSGADRRRSVFDWVFTVGYELRALASPLVRSKADGPGDGTPKTSLPKSRARRAVIRDPLYWAPSTHDDSWGMPATIGEAGGAWKTSSETGFLE
jgi:hypothetical protein